MMLTNLIGFKKNIFGARKEVHELPDHPSYKMNIIMFKLKLYMICSVIYINAFLYKYLIKTNNIF